MAVGNRHIIIFGVCVIGLAHAQQQFAPIAVARPESGRFEPSSFRDSVAKAIRDNLQKVGTAPAPAIEAQPDTNAQQNFNKFRQNPNAIPRIRVPIRKVQHKIFRPAPVQEQIEDSTTTTTTTTTRRPQFHSRIAAVQNEQTFQDEYIPAPTPVHTPVHRQPVHTPIIPKTPQVFVKEQEARKRSDYEEAEEEQARSAQYSFSSNIDDSINDNQMSRSEARDGLAVTGMYSYSDGFFKRTVHYIADENGYRVTKEDIQPIGDGPQYNPGGRADVSSSLAGSYTITEDDFKTPSRKDKEGRRRAF